MYPVCDPGDYKQTPNPTIPTLPEQFSTIIEGNIQDLNTSFIMSEHYDYLGNRGKLEYITGTEQREVAIFDYNLGEAFLIPDLERDVPCGVQPLTGPSELVNNSFGITYVNGSVHIGSVSKLFDLGINQSARYLGTYSVRGIPCNRWQTCHVLENESYVLDYYFVSTAEWAYIFSDETIPVQITLTGSRIDDDGMAYDMSHTYSFIGFRSGPDAVPDSVFEVPTGLPCLGRIAGKDLPDVPPYFSMLVEAVEKPSDVVIVREFYDTQLFRFDFQFNNTLYSIIHDFNLDIQYIIDRHLSNCYVTSLENSTDFFDVTTGINGTVVQRTPTDFFRLGSGYNFSYEGVTRLRGIDVDAWISVRELFPLSGVTDLFNGTVELFYTRPGVNSSSLYSSTSDPVPIAINITGILVSSSCSDETCEDSAIKYYNIFDFSSQEPDFDVFDTSLCATPGESEILPMIIPGQESGLDIRQLRRNIRLGLTEWADIPKLQVANIQISGENGTHIFATLQILPIPSIAQYDNPRTPQDILQQILNFTSKDDQLPFAINMSSGVSVMPFLLRVDPDCPTFPPTTDSTTQATASPSASAIPSSSAAIPSSSAASPSAAAVPSSAVVSSMGDVPQSTASSPSTAIPPIPSYTSVPTAAPTSTPDAPGTDCPTATSSGSSSSGGVSGGTAAGIAIAMFLLGMICGLVLIVVIRYYQSRRKSINLSKYRVQENELEGFD